MNKKNLLLISILLFFFPNLFSQTGTFDFSPPVSQDGATVSQTKDGITITIFSDYSTDPVPSMTLQDWSGFSSLYDNVACMNGMAKPSVTLSFSQPVNLASFVVCEFDGNDVHLQFTPNTGSPFDLTIDGFNGTVIEQDLIQVSSVVITKYGGGTVNLAFDNILIDGTLPVELSSFSANVKDYTIDLNWSTATEVNNYGFEIEKTKSVQVDKSAYSWVRAGFVEGYGNSNSSKNYSFSDKITESGKYLYRLKQIDNGGKSEYSKEVEVNIEAPKNFSLTRNYPNPFNPSTRINYSLPVESFVTIKVFDILGREVKTLVNNQQQAGIYELDFDGKDLSGGTYIYQIKTGDFTKTMKMILMK